MIDLGHVKAITAAVADAPAGAAALIEDEALAVAGEADPRAVAALMTRFRHALDPDAADAAALARYARRGITLSPLPDGAVHIKGLADEVTGAVLMTAIDAANPPVTGDTRTAAQQRMDALADICRKYLGSPHAPMTGGGHAHLIVALDATTLTNGHTHPDTDTTSDSDNATTRDSGPGSAAPTHGRDTATATPDADRDGGDSGDDQRQRCCATSATATSVDSDPDAPVNRRWRCRWRGVGLGRRTGRAPTGRQRSSWRRTARRLATARLATRRPATTRPVLGCRWVRWRAGVWGGSGGHVELGGSDRRVDRAPGRL